MQIPNRHCAADIAWTSNRVLELDHGVFVCCHLAERVHQLQLSAVRYFSARGTSLAEALGVTKPRAFDVERCGGKRKHSNVDTRR